MTGFMIGMAALFLWLGVMVTVAYLFKTAPGHPFRSMRRFRIARKTLRPEVVEAPAPELETQEPVEPEAPTFSTTRLDTPTLVVVEEVSPVEEMREIDALVTSITSEESVKPRRQRVGVPAKRGPRKAGRVSYVLVDEEGRPEL